MSIRQLLRASLAFLVLVLTSPTHALESDREQPIRIQADAALVDESDGSSVYRGNVIINQGTLLVTADEVEIYTSDSEVIQIIAKTDKDSDKLAHYEQQTNLQKDMVTADARKITYLVQEERLHLAGNARLKQVQGEFDGELLYYDIPNGIVSLKSGSKSSGDGKGRVNMTITPKKSR